MGTYYRDSYINVPFPPQTDDVKTKKKKTNKQGPFYFFMMDKRDEWITEGRWSKTNSMKQLVDECLPLWKMMKTNPALLEPYIEKSREFKMSQRNGLEEVFDTFGRSLADIKRQNQRVREDYRNMCDDIQETVEKSGRKIIEKEFYVAHFNYLCKTVQNFYPPCEASVVRFSIKEGILETWHSFVSPLDSIPVGYQYKCILHARNTHFLTKEFPHYDTNMQKILGELVEFLGGDETDLPPLYVIPDHIEAASCITDFILDKAGNTGLKLKIYSLTNLLQELAGFPSVTIAEYCLDDLTKDNHIHSLGCDIHASLMKAGHCSQSLVKRHVYNTLQACCATHSVTLKVGSHYPQETLFRPLKPSQLPMTTFAIEERINRKIPTPGGVTTIPLGVDEEIVKSLDLRKKENEEYFAEKPKPRGKSKSILFKKSAEDEDFDQIFPGGDNQSGAKDAGRCRGLGAIPKMFPASDIRESGVSTLRVSRPNTTFVKSGTGLILKQ